MRVPPVVKPNLRWQIALAMLCLVVVAALLSLSRSLATNPSQPVLSLLPRPTATPTDPCTAAPQGWLYEGLVGAPRYLNPLLSDANPVDQELVDLLFDGLLRYDARGRLVPALAAGWDVSDDGLTVTFTLRDDIFWQDGAPVTTADIAFTYGLLQDPAFPGAQRDKTLWSAVQIAVLDEKQVQFTLPAPYAPFLEATTRGLLPAHLWAGTTAATITANPLNSQPVGTGPFMVSGPDWHETGQLVLTANPSAGPTLQMSGLIYRFYADEPALLAAFSAGQLHAVNRLTAESVPDAAVLPGMRLFTAAVPRYTQLLFNLSETGFVGLKTLPVRMALAEGLDKKALITAALNGQALPLEGPYLPTSAAYDPAVPPVLASNPLSATADLESAGWLLPEGVPTGPRLGGEAQDVPFTLRLLVLDTAEQRDLAAELGRQWALIGVGVDVRLADPDTFQASLRDRAFDVALVTINPPADPDLYDFWSQEAIVKGQNYAAWNSRRASEALEAARQVWNQEERIAYYSAFLQFYAEAFPALTLYQPTISYGLSEQVYGADIGRIDSPRDRYSTAAEWSLNPPLDGCAATVEQP